MQVTLNLPTELPFDEMTRRCFRCFMQCQIDRLVVGEHRFGTPDKRKRYLDRIHKELKAYKLSGNMEHLLNLANYAFLESEAPQNRNFHFDPLIDSVTR